jgi:uncharacterized membrane protein
MKKEQNYKPWQRVLALLGVILVVGLLIASIVCAILGSPYFYGFLFAAIIIPVILYLIIWLGNVLKGMGEDKEKP